MKKTIIVPSVQSVDGDSPTSGRWHGTSVLDDDGGDGSGVATLRRPFLTNFGQIIQNNFFHAMILISTKMCARPHSSHEFPKSKQTNFHVFNFFKKFKLIQLKLQLNFLRSQSQFSLL